MEYLNWDTLQVPLATAVGAFGMGALQPPKIFQDLGKNEWFQWLLVFILIMQGGAGMQAPLAAVTTLVVYAIVKILDMMYEKKEGFY